MQRINPFDPQTIAEITARWHPSGTGIIYLDIVDFDDWEKQWGKVFCEQIQEHVINWINHFARELGVPSAVTCMGGDFFFMTQTESDPDIQGRQMSELGKRMKIECIRELKRSFSLDSGITLRYAQTVLSDDPSRDIEDIIYGAFKHCLLSAAREQRDNDDWLKTEDFHRILKTKDIHCVYQPIVSLTEQRIFGYEALTRCSSDSLFSSPVELFDYADKEGQLFVLDRMAREKALRGLQKMTSDQRIFLNIPSNVIHDPRFHEGITLKLLQELKLEPRNVVLEITERSSIEDFTTAKQILQHYRSQGFQIAIDDAGAGYSSLQAIAELLPDYIKIDRSLIQDVHSDKNKEYILETFVSFATKMNIRLIAEGIEQYSELDKLIRMGIHFAQGYLIGKPVDVLHPIDGTIISYIRDKIRSYNPTSHIWTVGDITVRNQTFELNTTVSEVARYFNENQNEYCVVIVDGQIPAGLVMRERLFQRLAEHYGISLFWKKPVHSLMEKNPLIVDEQTPVDQVSKMSMGRDRSQLYDHVVVVHSDGTLAGVASVRSILESMTNERLENARTANPLTGLPGNKQIQRELNRSLLKQTGFSVIYVDLDYFKWFNDCFGFQKGDELIQLVADILQHALTIRGTPHDFVGHIGGDDFIIISSLVDPDALCQEIIHRFEQKVEMFYEGEQVEFVQDRDGHIVDNQGVTISLSVVIRQCIGDVTTEDISHASAILKKKAKAHRGSIMVKSSLGDEQPLCE